MVTFKGTSRGIVEVDLGFRRTIYCLYRIHGMLLLLSTNEFNVKVCKLMVLCMGWISCLKEHGPEQYVGKKNSCCSAESDWEAVSIVVLDLNVSSTCIGHWAIPRCGEEYWNSSKIVFTYAKSCVICIQRFMLSKIKNSFKEIIFSHWCLIGLFPIEFPNVGPAKILPIPHMQDIRPYMNQVMELKGSLAS